MSALSTADVGNRDGQWGAGGLGDAPWSPCTPGTAQGEQTENQDLSCIANQNVGDKGHKILSRRKRSSGHKLRETTTAFCSA